MIIRMKKNVPWINYDYSIYRLNNGTGTYDSIGFTTENEFIDQGLANGIEYCYRITSTGWRSLNGVLYEHVNISHTSCTTPVDTIAPCPPDLDGFSLCDSGYNHITWSYSDSSCAPDVVGYKLYFSPTIDSPPLAIEEFDDKSDSAFNHFPDNSLTGCYFITAIDSFDNESEPSVRLCLDECSNYILPHYQKTNSHPFDNQFNK